MPRKTCETKIDRLTPFFRVGHRLSDQIHRVRSQERNASLRSRFLLFELDLLAEFLGQHRNNRLLDEIDGEANPVVIFVDVSERRRAGAGADG